MLPYASGLHIVTYVQNVSICELNEIESVVQRLCVNCYVICNIVFGVCILVFKMKDAKRLLHRQGSDDSIDSFVDYGSRTTILLDSNMAPGIDFYLRCLKCGKDFKSPALITSSELITCSCGSESICVIETA